MAQAARNDRLRAEIRAALAACAVPAPSCEPCARAAFALELLGVADLLLATARP